MTTLAMEDFDKMFGLLKKLLSPKRTDNGKSLKQVVDEIQHTHDLQ